MAFIAAPAYWVMQTREGPSQWGITRAGDVTFPSKKVLVALLFVWEPSTQSGAYLRPVPLALSDGAATTANVETITRGYPRGEGTWPGCEDPYAWPGIHTIGGVRGRDLP